MVAVRTDAPVAGQVHARFLALLPRLQTHAAITVRHVRCPHARAERIAEAIALAWAWFVRLHARGSDAGRFAAGFATLAARAAACGRRCCGQEPARDVLSPAAQRRHRFAVEPLRSEAVAARHRPKAFAERLADDRKTPVPDQVAFRIDWPAFFESLSPRDRDLATFLALGHSATTAAGRFGVTVGRVSQLRRQWNCAWQRFQASDSVAARV